MFNMLNHDEPVDLAGRLLLRENLAISTSLELWVGRLSRMSEVPEYNEESGIDNRILLGWRKKGEV
jgi:hypothetical protein